MGNVLQRGNINLGERSIKGRTLKDVYISKVERGRGGAKVKFTTVTMLYIRFLELIHLIAGSLDLDYFHV